jgi:general secretion pathway protein L
MLRDFFIWWFGQLADLLPERLRRSTAMAGEAVIVSPTGPLDSAIEGITVALRRGGRETLLGRFHLGTSHPEALAPAAGKPVVLRLGEAEVLAKTVSLPLAAGRDLDQVLGFEMDRETPFQTEELYWNHRVEATDRQNGRMSVRLLLLPRLSVAPLLSALGQMGLAPRRVEIASGPDAGGWVPLDGNGGRLQRSPGRLLWPAVACCVLLALAAIAIPFVQQAMALAAIEKEVGQGRSAAAEAENLRHEIEQLSRSAELIEKERAKAGRPLAVLAAATQILPDDTYLAELELRQRKITLSGRSGAAARLIGKLATGGEFQNPAFAAPVTRLEALHAEVFTITAEVVP